MLVDHQIRDEIDKGSLIIDPWSLDMLQPASVDLTLDRYFRVYTSNRAAIDPRSSERRTHLYEMDEGDTFTLAPQEFALASTVQKIRIPNYMVGKLEGKSSLARMGLFVHVTAGFFDPGFEGHGTLELFNAAPYPMILIPGMPICQMGFDYSEATHKYGYTNSFGMKGIITDHPSASHPYSGKYMNQERGPQESKFHKNFEDAEG